MLPVLMWYWPRRMDDEGVTLRNGKRLRWDAFQVLMSASQD